MVVPPFTTKSDVNEVGPLIGFVFTKNCPPPRPSNTRVRLSLLIPPLKMIVVAAPAVIVVVEPAPPPRVTGPPMIEVPGSTTSAPPTPPTPLPFKFSGSAPVVALLWRRSAAPAFTVVPWIGRPSGVLPAETVTSRMPPMLTIVGPLYVFTPASVSVPLPTFVRLSGLPLFLMMPAKRAFVESPAVSNATGPPLLSTKPPETPES